MATQKALLVKWKQEADHTVIDQTSGEALLARLQNGVASVQSSGCFDPENVVDFNQLKESVKHLESQVQALKSIALHPPPQHQRRSHQQTVPTNASPTQGPLLPSQEPENTRQDLHEGDIVWYTGSGAAQTAEIVGVHHGIGASAVRDAAGETPYFTVRLADMSEKQAEMRNVSGPKNAQERSDIDSQHHQARQRAQMDSLSCTLRLHLCAAFGESAGSRVSDHLIDKMTQHCVITSPVDTEILDHGPRQQLERAINVYTRSSWNDGSMEKMMDTFK